VFVDSYQIIRLSGYLLPLIALALALFFFIPYLFRSLQKWKKTDKPTYFSEFVILIALVISLLVFAYITALRASMYYEKYFLGEFAKFVLGFALIFLTSAIFIPQSLCFFRVWKKGQKSIHFSISALFAFLSFYSLSVIFSKLLILALGMYS
jgi:hypothetical protein